MKALVAVKRVIDYNVKVRVKADNFAFTFPHIKIPT
ncbi:MAG: electron transfer flavoprotein subunit beta/FixA family protein, partial [Psychrobacter sp.]|nr:electron transfer flavoprotein subunit beta/FixA family protein [Psychrobacter sp.]